MYQREYRKEQYICREGGVGTQLYVTAGAYTGQCECTTCVYVYIRMHVRMYISVVVMVISNCNQL